MGVAQKKMYTAVQSDRKMKLEHPTENRTHPNQTDTPLPMRPYL
jgi:hypothetical protein